IDLPGIRQQRLKENVANLRRRFPEMDLTTAEMDLTEGLPKLITTVGWDVVLVDVPCSNTGVIRRKPDLLIRLKPADLESLPVLQLALLESASAAVKAGGRLIYSTCSLEIEENRMVVDRFLEKHGEFSIQHFLLSHPVDDGHD